MPRLNRPARRALVTLVALAALTGACATPEIPEVVAPATPGDPSKVTLSAGQLLINQRISQAAVNRANDLIRRLGDGIGPEEIRDGSVSAIDLAPGVPVSSVPSP